MELYGLFNMKQLYVLVHRDNSLVAGFAMWMDINEE